MDVRWGYLFIDRARSEWGRAREFWAAVTGSGVSELRGDGGEFATLLPLGGGAAWLKTQAVAEGGGGCHLDLAVADVRAGVGEAVALGAALVADHGEWAVLRSPGGLAFCLVPWHGEAGAPEPHALPGAPAARVDQLCVDLSPVVHDAELAFWPALTGWRLDGSSFPEFHSVNPPAGMPFRLLLQRLGKDRPTSAHLDLACADGDADAVRPAHEALGARLLHTGPFWLTMADPTGTPYCLTRREVRQAGTV